MNDFHMRCSALATLMTEPRSIDPALLTGELAAIAAKKTKTDDDKALLAPLYDLSLSAGAKTYLNEVAKEFIYGYHNVVSSKYTTKGLIVEDQSILLYNERFFTSHAKNTERRTNDWITGECDIYTGRKIVDIKSSWSLVTFPELAVEGHDATYEWQVRGYMWLWDVDEAEVAYCLVDTPEELIGYENPELHLVERLPPELRITTVRYQRERPLEDKIARKVQAARGYLEQRVALIEQEHQP